MIFSYLTHRDSAVHKWYDLDGDGEPEVVSMYIPFGEHECVHCIEAIEGVTYDNYILALERCSWWLKEVTKEEALKLELINRILKKLTENTTTWKKHQKDAFHINLLFFIHFLFINRR